MHLFNVAFSFDKKRLLLNLSFFLKKKVSPKNAIIQTTLTTTFFVV